MVGNEDDTVVGLDDADEEQCNTKLALYPIALNGGGAGLYRDPREFANGNSAGFSCNNVPAGSRRAPSKSNVRFAWPYESKKDAGVQPELDIETGVSQTLNGDDNDDRTHRTRHSLGTLASAMNPWKVWENVHNEMSHLAVLRTRRQEDDASHVTLARQSNKAARVSSVYNDDDYDFALVLAPHDAYAFWASHLDFREEALHLVDDQGLDVEELDDDGQDDDSTIATATCEGAVAKKKSDPTYTTESPKQSIGGSGLRRRKTPTSDSKHLNRFSAVKTSTGRRSHRSPYRANRTSERVFSQRKSLFDRALDRFSPPGLSQRNLSNNGESKEDAFPTPLRGNTRSTMSPYVQRRRWGNTYDGTKLSTPNLTSPPIVSLKKGSTSTQKRRGSNLFQWRGNGARGSRGDGDGDDKKVDGEHPSSVKANNKRNREDEDFDASKDREDMFFASPGVPRGIAARVNGLAQFLENLKIGIVVRRHRKNQKSVFVQLFSDDAGDSIQFKFIPDDEAVIVLREQAQRYNGRRRKKKARLSFGEFESRRTSMDSETINQNDTPDLSAPLPDYLKAKKDREEDIRKKGGIMNTISHNALGWQNTRTIDSKDIVQVQPAVHIDPFSKEGDKLGTSSLRQSGTKYVERNTFSVIIPSMPGKATQDYSSMVGKVFPDYTSKDLTEKWCEGEHQPLFHSLDIEMATEGEYWMVLKGFILLHRDASTGRFAAQRAGQGAGGFGSYHRHAEIDKSFAEGRSFNEALPPPTTMIQKLTRRGDDAKQAEDVMYNATAPPSDYFLGFSSPGTQIWGRLRQAGLETQRLYALDTRKVMIKVRCPVDRLQDVAEALKLKLKTKDGEYAPFREDIISQFAPTDDGFVSCEDDVERVVSLFRSSERQKIIDFIIGSRIRDSGAELGTSTELGKQIQRRVPLHSHARLEALYTCWVLFWYPSNWSDRDGKSLQVGKTKPDDKLIKDDPSSIKSSTPQDYVPQFLYRFFVGCFYQPLDSIEEYYGEKIAFYFAWLQHCSFHLLYLSVVGLIVFICQITSGNWDHPLRPWFAILVMIWSFVVMVTWRRRSNFLAYQWGTLDYQEEVVARPEFKGTEYRICPITNTYIPYYPPWKRWLKMCISIPLTIGFTVVTLLGILILYGNRDAMLANYFASGDDHIFLLSFSADAVGKTAPIMSVELNRDHLHDPKFWLIVVGFPSVLGLILPLLNFCLRRISLWLNEIENHRTEAEHRTHFIIKVFAFRFVCYFAALYYYSFIGVGTQDPQATEHGILRVASTLFTYVTIAHWWAIFLQVFFPLLLHRWRVYRERLRLRNELRSLEMMELELAPSNEQDKTADERLELKKQLLNKRLLFEHAQVNIWEEMMLPEHDSFTEYLFAVTQFAFVTCFSVVLPITPFIVLINHLLNMRLDAFKICRGRRRPLSQKTGGIGVWNHVLHVVTVLAILTNCSLMALTSFQFSWLTDQIGPLGVFALAIGWEHLMLLVKYIMQLTVSSMPASVQNEMRRKKYDQERKRYMTLRAKKDRRSGSVGLAGDKASGSVRGEGDTSEKISNGTSFTKSPCPPIRESSAESYSPSSPENSAEKNPVEVRRKKDDVLDGKPQGAKGGIVNVRAIKCHSPLQDQYDGSHRRGSRQKLPSRNRNSPSIGKRFGGLSSNATKHEENNHPNFEEAISKLPWQPPSTNRSPLQTRDSGLNESGAKYLPNSYLQRSGPPPSNARQGYGSRRDAEIGRSRLYEEAASPSSSLSTVPGLPTPCHLNLDSDDDTLHTVEDGFTPVGFYPDATAPPLSPSNPGYGARTTVPSGSAYFDGYSEKVTNDDDHSGPEAKWGVHHILHYARSERSMSLSERKKSR